MSNQHDEQSDIATRASPSRLTRRRFAQGLSAAPVVAGAAMHGITPARAQEEVTIRFWTHTHPPMVDQNEIDIAAFMEANPGITVEYEVIPNIVWDHYM